MKAIVIHEFGGPEVLRLEEVARPTPDEEEVLVRVYAAGVNPLDWKLRLGYYDFEPPEGFPYILGLDVAGVVEEVGAGVTNFAVGDEVYGVSDYGGYAEYARVKAKWMARKPASLDFVQAAVMPCGALTAWDGLIVDGHLQAGQRVVIQGAAGGVGSFAVQLAKWRGAHVTATGSAFNHDFLCQLGADEVIDYRTAPLAEQLVAGSFDLVFDAVGGESQAELFAALKPEGMLASIVDPTSPEIAQMAHYMQTGLNLDDSTCARLAEIARLVDTGQVRPIVSRVFPFAEIAEAHRLLEGRHMRGKIALQVR